MMFAGRAAATKANFLSDTGASADIVSKTFAKQTGIMVRLVDYFVCLADDKTMEVAGEATVQLGAFYKPMKWYVIDMLPRLIAYLMKLLCFSMFASCIIVRVA
jgi:hypothetical protein